RFEVMAPPLLRFALLRLSAERHRLLISNHHLLMDGWSAPILVREALQAYGRGGRADDLPAVTAHTHDLGAIARGRSAGGDAVPRLSGVDRASEPRGRTCSLPRQPVRA